MKILLFFLPLFLFGCTPELKMISLEGRTMGTTYVVKYFPKSNSPKSKIVSQMVDEVLIALNKKMSTYIKDSEISKFNRSETLKWVGVSKDLHYVLSYAEKVSSMSEGAFDITIGPLVNLWGFGPNKKKLIPTPEKIREAKERVGYKKLMIDPKEPKIKKLNPRIYLDLSSLAKGYGVDLVSKLLNEFGVENYFIEIGGEIKTRGKKPSSSWRIAIQAPEKIYVEAKKILNVSNLSIATSGNYRNFFKVAKKRYSHTINSATGKPVTNKMASVTVIDKTSCMKADALATMMMALGAKRARFFAEKYKIPVFFLVGALPEDDKNLKRFSSYESPEFKKLFK
jgi:FAD:protein FMN transferase